MLLWNKLQSKATSIPVLNYLLRATWGVGDQSFSDAQVLGTSEGVEDGSLTVVETSGSIEVLSNKARAILASQTLNALGLKDATSYTAALGTAFISERTLGQTNVIGAIEYWGDAQTFNLVNDRVFELAAVNDATIEILVGNGAGATLENPKALMSYSAGTQFKWAVVLGGFDTNGTPYYSGQTKSSYGFGAWFMGYDGSDWLLLWPTSQNNIDPLYYTNMTIHAPTYSDTGRTVIPDSDLSAIQEAITNFSSFDGTNGTSLDAITPEVGGSWTEQVGTWDITSNKVANTLTGSTQYAATIASGESDIIGRVDYVLPSGTESQAARLLLRYSDISNFWALEANAAANELRLRERNGGTFATRASASVTVDANNTYTGTVVADGQTITGYLDGGNRVTYASASLNETETKHGIGNYADGANINPEYDNFMIFPRTSSAYGTALDAV